MNETVLTTIALTGFTVAFFTPRFRPTGCPSWQRVVRNVGVALSSRIGTWFPRTAGALLIGLGLFYVWRQLSGHAHSHTHLFSKGGHGGNEHEHKHQHELKEALAHFRAPDISRTRTPTGSQLAACLPCLPSYPVKCFCRFTFREFASAGAVCPANPYSLHRRSCRSVGFHLSGPARNLQHRTWLV